MIDPDVLEFAQADNFAAFVTYLPDGAAMTHVMWVDADAEHILINTEVHRQKFKNVERDPRVTVMIWDAENPYRYAEVRGDVVAQVRGPEAREHIEKLSFKYTGKPYAGRITSERVILKVAPVRQQVRRP